MSPEVYRVFEEIFEAACIVGPVLEVGAVAGQDGLLQMHSLGRVSEKIGLNLKTDPRGEGAKIIQGDANDMAHFPDGYFAAVICNSMLEHDLYFWKAISEIHRVTDKGGLIAIGVPGFAGMGLDDIASRKSLIWYLLKFYTSARANSGLKACTLTLGEHHFPGDYYRFTERTMRELFLAGLDDIRVRRVMNPPRFIGWGRKM